MLKLLVFGVICLISSKSVILCVAQDVIGCGGFIKSDVNIDLSKVKIQLLTSYGSVKHSTEPAPNGYYMIPIYEKGDYQISITPKSGWNFEPKGAVTLDLEACERNEDINFVFTGFQVSGKVLSEGSTEGPSDVTVSLKLNGKELKTTKTVQGSYMFDNVKAGEYTVHAAKADTDFTKSEVKVTVKDDALESKDSLIVHGYSVSGKITNEGQAVKGVQFVLQSDSNKNAKVKGCTAGAPTNYNGKAGALCYTTSDESGSFVFLSVPVGTYNIIPYHRGEKTVFEVQPSSLNVEVTHADHVIKSEFTVSGFGVHGQVKYSAKGKSVVGASVSLNGRKVATTDSNGMYAIDGMKAGTYSLSVEAPKVYFDEITVKMLPSEPMLPLLTPSRFDVCGKMLLDKSLLSQLLVKVTDSKQSSPSEVPVGSDGVFCTRLSPGTYTIEPVIKSGSSELTLTPSSHSVTVTDSAVDSDSVKFSQFKAVMSGKVTCLSSCDGVEVILKGNNVAQRIEQVSSSSMFRFSDVTPGEYTVSASKSAWCWEDNSLTVRVDDKDVKDLQIKQKGFVMQVDSTIALKLQYNKKVSANSKQKTDAGELTVIKGLNELCMPSMGTFQLTPVSCHQFEKSSYLYNTESAGEVVHISCTKHKVMYKLISDTQVDDVILHVRSSDNEVQDLKMPATKLEGKVHVSTMEGLLSSDIKSFEVTASSSVVLFDERKVSGTISSDECPAALTEIHAVGGQFIEGAVNPALEGLSVSLLSGGEVVKVVQTDKHGKYRFGPLPKNEKYEMAADKPGYVLAKNDKNPLNFDAYKLAEVAVHVASDDKTNLAGVIISLSGSNYRSNNLTNDDGMFSFIGLSPGKYYLMAILKEYEFSPASQQIEVKEGITTNVKVVGKRVAYSCMGSVVTLKGEAVSSSVMVKAHGVAGGECANTEESSQVEVNGQFRIRGLKPGCTYKLSLIVGEDGSSPSMFRVSPENSTIDMKTSDMDAGRFVVIEGSAQTQLTVFINTSPQFLSTVKIVLHKEGASTTLQSLTPDSSKVVFFNSLPLDRQKYKIVLESSLSGKLYEYSSIEQTFEADSPAKALTVEFNPKMKSNVEYDVKESSVLALVVVIVSTLLVFNKDKILGLIYKQD